MLSSKFVEVSALAFCAVLFSVSARAGEGGNTSGGGDSVAAHFGATAERVASTLEQVCSARDSKVRYSFFCRRAQQFSGAVAGAQVLPRESVVGPDGHPREAINDGVRTIELDTSAWGRLLETPFQYDAALRLVTHEYSQLAKLEASDTYEFSSQLLRELKAADVEPLLLLDLIPTLQDASNAFPISGIPSEPFEDEAIKPLVAAACLKVYRTPWDATSCVQINLANLTAEANHLRECALEGFPCKGNAARKIMFKAPETYPGVESDSTPRLPPFKYFQFDWVMGTQNPFIRTLFSHATGKKVNNVICADHLLARNRCWVQ
jgi:hypothetical protein